MEIDYEKTVRYINTDLVLTAPVDLTSLAEVISPKSESTAPITRLHVGYIDGIGYQATFEAFDQYGNFKTPEESINCLLNCIEQLPVALQSLWQACSKKTLDIGYSSGVSPRYVINPISIHTLASMQSLGVDISITIYSMTE